MLRRSSDVYGAFGLRVDFVFDFVLGEYSAYRECDVSAHIYRFILMGFMYFNFRRVIL